MIKRLSILLMLAVAASISILAVTNLWSGSNTLEGNDMDISNNNNSLSSLKIGDKVKISFENTEEGEIKVTVQTEQGTKTLFEDYHVAANTGSLTFDVTQDFIDGIKKDNKMKIMAKKLTITSVDAITGEGGAGEDPDPVDPTDNNYELELPIAKTTFSSWYDIANHQESNGSAFAYVKPGHMPGLKAGDEIWAYFTNNGGGQANFVFKGTDGNWIKVGEDGQTNPDWINSVESNKKYIFPVKEEWVEALAANGLYIDGAGISLDKVVFYAKARDEKPTVDDSGEIVVPGSSEDPKPETKGILVWDDNLPAGNWTGEARVPASTFAHFTTVTGIRVEVSSIGSDAQYQLRYGGNADANLPNADAVGFSNGPIEYTVETSTAASLKTNGLIVKGQNYTINKIYILGETDGTEIPVGPGEEIEDLPDYMTRTVHVLWEAGKGSQYPYVTLDGNGSLDQIKFGSEWLAGQEPSKNTDGESHRKGVHLPASLFPEVNLDDKIVVTFADYNNATASFYYLDTNGDWFTRGTGDANNVATEFQVNHAVQTRQIVNYRGAGALKTNGLWIDGVNAEIKKIEYVNYNNKALSNDDTSDFPRFKGDPIQDFDNVDFNQPRGFNVTQNDAEYPSELTSELRRVRPRAFTNYRNGERIRFVFEQTADKPWFRINFVRPNSANMRVSQGLTGTDDGIFNSGFEETEEGLVATYIPTQREIRALTVNGLFLDGAGLKLKKIIFGLDNPGDLHQNIWLHNDWVTLGHTGEGKNYEGDVWYEWEVHIYVSHSHFKRAQANGWLAAENDGTYDGYHLLFQFPWAGENAQFNVWYDPSNVHDTNIDPLNQYYEAAFPAASYQSSRAVSDQVVPQAEGAQKFSFSENPLAIPATGNNDNNKVARILQRLTTEDVNNMLNYGFWMNGSNADFQNVMLQSKLSVVSAIESVAAETPENLTIDFTEPYEAYTTDGRRVADAKAPGLYIIRQGNLVQKILVK